jgi:outer membrane protein TolC
MSCRPCFAAFLLILSAAAAWAQESAPLPPPPATAEPTPGTLTLEEAVRRALARNFTLQIQNFSSANAEQALIAARAAFDPEIQANLTRSGSRTPDEGSFVDAEGNIITNTATRADATRSRIGVSQRLTTGTTVGLSGRLDRSRASPSRSRFNPAYDSDVTLSVSQSLLRGFGTTYNRAFIEQAEIDVVRAGYDFRGAVLDIVRSVETAYYNLGYTREQLLVQRFSLAVAEQLLEENRARRDTGVSTDLDVLQAEVGVANARRDVLLREQDVNDATDQLLQLIGQFEFDEVIGDVRIGEVQPPEVSFDQSYRLARENRPDFAAQEALIEQLRIDARVARSNRLPDVAVNGAVGYNTREDTYKAAASELWEGDGYAWQLGLSLSVPWGSRADRARYQQALNNLAREEARLQSIDQNILVQVRTAVRAVETNAESVRISRLATELSERQFELEKARFDAGLSTFRRVQEAQEDLDAARVSELQARVSLRVALAELARLEGSSLERFQIDLL